MTNILKYLRIIGIFFLLLFSFSLIGCGGGGSSESEVVPISENQRFKQFLYSDPQASLEYFTDLSVATDGAIASAAFTASGIDASGYSVNIIRITYLNNNLPQYAIHISDALLTPWVHFHAVYEIIDDKDHYMHFFIDPAVIFPSLVDKSSSFQPIDKLKVSGLPAKRYDETSYVGLSGGGNTGLSACAVFSFKKCILVAGFLPFYLRVSNINSWGDAEQITKSFYSIFPYEKIMEIAASTSKKVVYIYNRFDPCCFADPEATRFRNDFPKYDIRVVDNDYHSFDSTYIVYELSR